MKKTSKKVKKVKKGTKASGHRGTKAKKKAVKKGTKATPPPVTVTANEKTAEEELSINNKLFGDEYLKHFKAGPAYAKIYGCSLRAAGANASRLLKTNRMQAYLQRKIANIQLSNEVSIDQVLRECARIAMADPISLYNDDGTFKRIQDIPVDLRRAISGFKVEEVWEWEGEGDDKKRTQTGRIIDVKLWSKDKQLEHLFKYNGLFEKDNEQNRALTLADIAAMMTEK